MTDPAAPEFDAELPIDASLPEIVEKLRRASSLVIVAPPGAGKTTRVPRALLDRGFADKGEIVVLEPRRIAARLAARRVADELGESVGNTVGYTMRFEDRSSAATKIRFVTEGTLTRRLLGDALLPGVSVVLLDEVHERNLEGDLALAWLRRLQLGARPDLRLVAMSATLEAEPIARFLGADVVHSEGRRFDVAIEHAPERDDRRLEDLVALAVKRLVAEDLDGDVLVFLPGSREIRKAYEALAAFARSDDLLVVPLHGSLSPAEQDRAVRRAETRKIVLATNVAETSVTIDGIAAVIDSGLARVASHAPWSGLPTLKLAKIARAQAVQRAGRAGRTRPGRCLRLYTLGDFNARPEHESPEIARADLAGAALDLFGAGVDPDSFPWFEAPPPRSLEAAIALLERLGAIDGARRPTDVGRRMLRFPTHPRLARLVVEAERRGIANDGATIAALLGERDLGTSRNEPSRHGSDVLALLDRFDEAEAARFEPSRLIRMGIDPGRAASASRVRDQLGRLVDRSAKKPANPVEFERAVGLAVLAAYPDRVGRLRRPANATGRAAREIVFAKGGTAALAPSSGVADVELLVAVDVEERQEGKVTAPVVRIASGTDDAAMIELFSDVIRDETIAVWNASAERVDVVRRLVYDGLVLDESEGGDPGAAEIARVLGEAVRSKGWRAFTNDDALDAFVARVAFAREHAPNLEFPDFDEDGIERALAALCEGASSFADLRARGLGARIRAMLTPEQTRALDDIAPDSIVLQRGRRLKLVYAKGEPPRAASRLQDFFGMREGPRAARGEVPIRLELLAPNGRAVQITTDLAGFWSRHYPALAKELRRKYPKHAFPENPLA